MEILTTKELKKREERKFFGLIVVVWCAFVLLLLVKAIPMLYNHAGYSDAYRDKFLMMEYCRRHSDFHECQGASQ